MNLACTIKDIAGVFFWGCAVGFAVALMLVAMVEKGDKGDEQ